MSSSWFQFFHFNSFVSFIQFNSFLSIRSCQLIHVKAKAFISCISFHFNSILCNSPWIPISHVSFSKLPPWHVPGTTWYLTSEALWIAGWHYSSAQTDLASRGLLEFRISSTCGKRATTWRVANNQRRRKNKWLAVQLKNWQNDVLCCGMGWWSTLYTVFQPESCWSQLTHVNSCPFLSPQHGWTLLHRVCCKAWPGRSKIVTMPVLEDFQLIPCECLSGAKMSNRPCFSVSRAFRNPCRFLNLCVLTLAQKCVYFGTYIAWIESHCRLPRSTLSVSSRSVHGPVSAANFGRVPS